MHSIARVKTGTDRGAVWNSLKNADDVKITGSKEIKNIRKKIMVFTLVLARRPRRP